jgi:hypothetical protein
MAEVVKDLLFFYSYAREDVDKQRKFYDDLIKEIKSATGRRDDGIGFFDQENLKIGDDWPENLKQALRKCRVFVYLHSPTYFQSEWCGKEWFVFQNRVERYLRSKPPGTARPPLMLLVLWVPCKPPAHILDIQFNHRGLGDAYVKFGLRQLMIQNKSAYKKFLPAFATRVIEAAAQSHLPEGDELPPFKEISNAFATSAPGVTGDRGKRFVEAERAFSSTEPDPPKGGARSDTVEPPDDQDESLWSEYRPIVRDRLEELLIKLGENEGQGSGILVRLAAALQIGGALDDEKQARRRIIDHLLEAKEEYAIPRMIRLHGELCEEGRERLAGPLADCVDWILPLHFSPEAIRNTRLQLQVQRAVLIERAVATHTGAEVVMSHFDRQQPSFLQDQESIPRGKSSVPFELSAIGNPALDDQVVAVLEDLAKGTNVPPLGRARTKDVAARTAELAGDLGSWLGWDKEMTHRTRYCALAMPESLADRENLKRVLQKVHELVPPLVFIELSPESQTRGIELAFIKCLNTRFESGRKQRSR